MGGSPTLRSWIVEFPSMPFFFENSHITLEINQPIIPNMAELS